VNYPINDIVSLITNILSVNIV